MEKPGEKSWFRAFSLRIKYKYFDYLKQLVSLCPKFYMKFPVCSAAFFREALLPSYCALCHSVLVSPEECYFNLCASCSKTLILEEGERCVHCGRPLISELGLCTECRGKEKPAYDSALALYPYGGMGFKILRAYKFGSARYTGHFLAEKLLMGITRILMRYGTVEALVPVPPRPGKLRVQGWDQVDYLARCIAGKTSIPLRRCLRRLPSKSQKVLNRTQRAVNLLGRIRCTHPPGARVILFDDIITTGSTFHACAAALKAAGVLEVHTLALFYD